METFKAWLVAKGYTQKEGFDYEATFSPVAMIKSIRILLSIVVHMDYEIWQMDVKIAFLNGSLDETIYMVQLEGFIAKGQKMKCASCKSPFIDLSMHRGLGTSSLTIRSNNFDLSNTLMAYPKIHILIRFLLGSTCKILRSNFFLSELESLY